MSESSSWRLALGALSAVLGVAMSAAAYRAGRPDGPVLFWGVLPGAPLILLSAFALIPRISIRALAGALVGGLVAAGIPYGLLWYSSVNYSGGGANIGLGLLLLAQPIYVPLAMITGACVGHFLSRSQAAPRATQVPRR